VPTIRNKPLPRSFYDRDVALVARELLGKLLIRKTHEGLCSGRIVEAEAYLAEGDPACHAHRGKTRKNATMFGPPGHAYVYSIHARWCLNAVTLAEGVASAALIRAIEPIEGLPQMAQRRGTEKLLDLARGPSRLCEALDIDRRMDGCDLTRRGELWITDDGAFDTDDSQIATSPRIGVTSAHDLLLRFFLTDNPYVSGPRRLRFK
jgi:DNA-3-methyladenine glycosylase